MVYAYLHKNILSSSNITTPFSSCKFFIINNLSTNTFLYYYKRTLIYHKIIELICAIFSDLKVVSELKKVRKIFKDPTC